MNIKGFLFYLLSVVVCIIGIFNTNATEGATSVAPIFPGNVLQNPSFEESSKSIPAFWVKVPVRSGKYDYYVADNAHAGKKSLAIKGTVAGRGMCYNGDVYVVKGAKYRLSCWVRTEGAGISANVSLAYSGIKLGFKETETWKLLESEFIPSDTGMEIIQFTSYGLGTVFLDDNS